MGKRWVQVKQIFFTKLHSEILLVISYEFPVYLKVVV